MEPRVTQEAIDRFKAHYARRWILAIPFAVFMTGVFVFFLVNQLGGKPATVVFLASWGLGILWSLFASIRWFIHHRCPACKVQPYPIGPKHCPNCGFVLFG